MEEALRKEIEKIIETQSAQRDAEVFGLTIHAQRKDVRVVVFVDKPAGGISLEECAQINRASAAEIDGRQLLPQGYVLEVNSPGLDWLLRNKRDFLRARGRQVHLKLKEPVQNVWEFDARVLEAQDDAVMIEWEGRPVPIPLEKIQQAIEVV